MLEVIDISKQFPGVNALDNVLFDVRVGEIHARCNENGVGKNTRLNSLSQRTAST